MSPALELTADAASFRGSHDFVRGGLSIKRHSGGQSEFLQDLTQFRRQAIGIGRVHFDRKLHTHLEVNMRSKLRQDFRAETIPHLWRNGADESKCLGPNASWRLETRSRPGLGYWYWTRTRRDGSRHWIGSRTCLDRIRGLFPQQVHIGLESNLLRRHELFEPNSLIVGICRPARGQAEVATFDKLGDLATQSQVRSSKRVSEPLRKLCRRLASGHSPELFSAGGQLRSI